jgi:hypothetical protein
MKRILYFPDSPAGIAPAPNAPSPSPKPAAPAPPSPTPAPSPSPAPAPTPEPSDDPFEAPKKPAAAPGAKPDVKPAVAAPDDTDKLAPKELRERVKQLRAENQTYPGKIKSLEDKIKSFEAQGKDTTALTTRLTAIEKERDAALADLRAAKQEASPEFKEKWDKPFKSAAERAKKQITELTVVQKTDDVGTVTRESRPATWADFTALYSLPVGKAIEQANDLFGPTASFVLGLRDKLLDLDSQRATALEDERAQFKDRNAREIAEQTRERETVSKTWQETNARLAETVADYKNDPEDTELNDARKHALSVFDSQIEAADRQAFFQKKVKRDAHIRQRVGAFPVLKIMLSRKDAEIATLKAQVEELKGAAPGGVRRPGGGDNGGGEESWEAGLAKAVSAE